MGYLRVVRRIVSCHSSLQTHLGMLNMHKISIFLIKKQITYKKVSTLLPHRLILYFQINIITLLALYCYLIFYFCHRRIKLVPRVPRVSDILSDICTRSQKVSNLKYCSNTSGSILIPFKYHCADSPALGGLCRISEIEQGILLDCLIQSGVCTSFAKMSRRSLFVRRFQLPILNVRNKNCSLLDNFYLQRASKN